MLTQKQEITEIAEDELELKSNRLAAVITIPWLGQTIASLSWIVSVFVYGITSPGDWLQLLAASAWFIANLAQLQADLKDKS